jgi:hypothetical protein
MKIQINMKPKKDLMVERFQQLAGITSISEIGTPDMFKSEKEFDWEDYYDDSDLNGASVEIAMDDLIMDFEEVLQKTFPADPKLRDDARHHIKDLWAVKISSWRDRNRGAGIPGGE